MLYPARVSRRIPIAILISVTCIADPRMVCGQEGTAVLEVVVEPPSALPVRLRAPGLERYETPDEGGRAVFLHLPAGVYVVEGCGPPLGLRPGETRRVRCLPSEPELSLPAAAPRSRDFDATTDFDREDLGSLPRPADPWSALRDVPGVVVDRVNVGGSESEQQSLLVSHGDPAPGATWSLDGVDVTDPAALGSSLLYPDQGALETVTARTGALHARVRTPGVQVALAGRAPRAQLSGAAHLRGSWEGLQSDNLPEDLEGRPFYRNRTQGVSELGAELGGPLHAGRAWLFGSFYRNALAQETFTGHEEDLRTSALTARGRVRLGGGTLRLLAVRGDKVHEDRDTGLSSVAEARWRQTGPTWVLGVEDQRPWRRSSVLTHLSWVDGGFRLEAQGGQEPSAFEDFRGVLQRSYASFETQRRRLQGGLELKAERRALGASHRLEGGIGFWHAPTETRQAWPGNGVFGLERQGVFFRTFRLTGFALPYRESVAEAVTSGLSAYFSDELRFSRFAAFLGLRLERLSGANRPSSVRANPEFPELLPAVAYDGSGEGIRWLDLLPRAGLALALGSRTTLRAGYAAYAAPLGTAETAFDNPLRELASVTYYWKDANADAVVQSGELDLVRGRLGLRASTPRGPRPRRAPTGSIPIFVRREPTRSSRRRSGVWAKEPRSRCAWAGGVSWTPSGGPCETSPSPTTWRGARSAARSSATTMPSPTSPPPRPRRSCLGTAGCSRTARATPRRRWSSRSRPGDD